jgi:hypothetical protein
MMAELFPDFKISEVSTICNFSAMSLTISLFGFELKASLIFLRDLWYIISDVGADFRKTL